MSDIEIGNIPTPIVKANVEHKTILTPDGFAAVLVPDDNEPRHGQVILYVEDGKMKRYSSVVASACEGDRMRTTLEKTTLEVLNVVPKHDGLYILVKISNSDVEAIRYRVHVIVYY